ILQLNGASGTTFDPHIVQAMTWLVQTEQIVVGATVPGWTHTPSGDGQAGAAAA
ncbi:MAG: hypothetical protein H7123_03500, partial [Thermoleophilia bacterium]|nr:hypothetical protein [Thermoleophilia bacterium]